MLGHQEAIDLLLVFGVFFNTIAIGLILLKGWSKDGAPK